ncbi:MAG: fibrobacter succinogenes major paralogous domain-containing protein [Fibromonadaceae bacterium]|jgi:uncharacterized protein (TIGR02145 family)|nr:fibrobacter succinogenes major paralogous domain-containing protein [Fibromonadaceae bacterium]
MNRVKITLAAGIAFAMAFTFISCSSGSDDDGGGNNNGGSNSGGGYTGSYGSLSYQGKTYKTVKIGNQTWMAENMNYNAAGSVCYENSESNCNKYGRLYNWETAMAVCPSGWHLPSDDEWTTLENFVSIETAGTKLKAFNGWNDSGNGTDDYGFSALPGGHGGVGGNFILIGSYGNWWCSTEDSASNVYYRAMDSGNTSVGRDKLHKFFFRSVRCLQD